MITVLNRSGLRVRLLLFLFLVVGICVNCDERRSKNQTIIYDLYLDMQKDSFTVRMHEYLAADVFRGSKTMMPFESEFDLNGQIGEVSINPIFNESGILDEIQFEMCFKAWAPWNKTMNSDDVIRALQISNNLWPGIKFRQKETSWASKYNGCDIEVSMRDEKYLRGIISN